MSLKVIIYFVLCRNKIAPIELIINDIRVYVWGGG